MKRPELMNPSAKGSPPAAPHGAGRRAQNLVCGLAWAQAGFQTSGPVIGDEVMYSIGGGSAVSIGRRWHASIGVGVGWNSNLICGDMSIQTTLRNQLNGITRWVSADHEQRDPERDQCRGIAACADHPAADPGLYNLLTNGVLQARLDFDRSKLTCRAMAEDGRDCGRPTRLEDGRRHGVARCGVEHGCRIGDRAGRDAPRQRRRYPGGRQQCRRRGPVRPSGWSVT